MTAWSVRPCGRLDRPSCSDQLCSQHAAASCTPCPRPRLSFIRFSHSNAVQHTKVTQYTRRIHRQLQVNCQAAAKRTPARLFGYAQDFDSRYELLEKLGAGGFGTVYKAVSRLTGEEFAAKVITKRWGPAGAMEPLFVKRMQHEVDICNHVGRSLNIAYLYGAFEDSKSVTLVMELCKGGELWKQVRSGRYSEKDAAKSVRDILRTIAQCHSRGVLIRDVKPENFLLLTADHDSPLKAIDFGLATYCKAGQYLQDKAGTAIYIAPEVLRQKYSLPSDLWSAGIIAYQLITGWLPFAGEDGEEVSSQYMQTAQFDHKEVFRAVLYSDLDFERAPWDSVSPECKDLVQSLLQRDPAKRPTAAQALQHRWLSYAEDAASDTPLGGDVVQRLQRFGTYGRLKQIALRKIAHSIERDSSLVGDVQAAFQALDPQNTGRIGYEDAAAAVKQGGFDLSGAELQQLVMQLVDETDEQGYIQYDSWLAAMVDWRAAEKRQEWHDWVQKAFQAFDKDGSGSIGIRDLQEMLCGEVPDTVEAALREADVLDQDGNISLEEFESLMHSSDLDVLDLFDTRHHS